MPPRKSFTPNKFQPTSKPSTSKRRHPLAESIIPTPSPRRDKPTRSRRNQTQDPFIEDLPQLDTAEGKENEESVEKELEAWQDFAAEHYEILEQLPLELHRNFRLLRELDEGSSAQTEKLHALIRSYMGQRLAAVLTEINLEKGDLALPEAGKGTGVGLHVEDEEEEVEEVETVEVQETAEASVEADALALPEGDELEIPQPDGEGGLVLPPEGEIAPITELTTPIPSTIPNTLLSEISRLSKEIVRSGEEKVAVAVGAYNAVDRHIRALDSALQNTETSLLLGLRTATNPSSALDSALNLADGVYVDEKLGGPSGRKKKGKKAVLDVIGLDPLDGMEVDPNEPRYCYCNKVSYGEMIGCEDEDCPMGWFHLACCGLETVPQGKWWCTVCKPVVGDTVVVHKVGRKRRRL